MNRYQLQNAAEKIRGYLVPRPTEDGPTAFERAKKETLTNMATLVANVEALTYEQFSGKTKTV